MTFTGKFVLGFLSQIFSIHRIEDEGGRYLFNSTLPFPSASQTPRRQPRGCCREFISAHSQQPDSNQESYCLFMFYYILLCFIIFIFYYILFVSLYILIYTYYTVAKKENALIIHIAMETWEYTTIRNFITLYLCLFSNYSHTLWLKTRYATDGYKYKTINLQLTQ